MAMVRENERKRRNPLLWQAKGMIVRVRSRSVRWNTGMATVLVEVVFGNIATEKIEELAHKR